MKLNCSYEKMEDCIACAINILFYDDIENRTQFSQDETISLPKPSEIFLFVSSFRF